MRDWIISLYPKGNRGCAQSGLSAGLFLKPEQLDIKEVPASAAENEVKIMDPIIAGKPIADPAAEIMVITPASGIRDGTGSDQAAVNTVQPEFDCSPVMQC